MDMFNEMPEVQGVILCASSAYEEKYYFNQEFANVPPSIQDELRFYASCIQQISEAF